MKPLKTTEFFLPHDSSNPTKLIGGESSFDRLGEEVAAIRPKAVLVVMGRESFRKSSFYQKLEKMLNNYEMVEASAIDENPRQQFLQDEMNRLAEFSYDLVIAIGGGSVLDAAKLFALSANEADRNLFTWMEPGWKPAQKPVPLIAIPTTAGSGSEVTPFASIETFDLKKVTLCSTAFYPKVAIVDPRLTWSMPPYISASTGFDAISQAIESFWSIHATPESKKIALWSVGNLKNALEKAVSDPENQEARAKMAAGSCAAGLAIARTKTTAVHSVSYPITTHFGVAHGHACALTLPSFIRFNGEALKETGAPLLRALGVPSYDAAARFLESLMDEIKLQRKLSDLNISEEGIELIVREGFRPDRIKNNPREVTAESLRAILRNIY